ncbi:MAG: gliding motility-associated C-terminal domain-containing protein [Bacteroidetes bacterium]|nr:gliding motility-associated C-terminal domain-containing protein [Bacteroidota bacterium]
MMKKNIMDICFFLKLAFILGVITFLCSFKSYSQVSTWEKSPFEYKVFVENLGQFDGKDKMPENKIQYGVENMGFQIYFTEKGLTYRMDEWGKSDEKNKMLEQWESGTREYKEEQRKNGNREKMKLLDIVNTSLVNIEWMGANPKPYIIADEQTSERFHYNISLTESINHAKSYKKIIYKNLYPGIDLVYSFPENRPGIKYAFIVHPGANVAVIKMKYSGSICYVDTVTGNINIPTLFGDIIDHAPYSFYETPGKVVESSFKLDNNVVSFHFPNGYDKSKTLVIDPWTTNPVFTSQNKALDVDRDAAGNVYVYGGLLPFKLRKYNSAGVPQWTSNTIPSSTNWFGDLVTTNSGVSYVSNGQGNGEIQKIDPNGLTLVTNTTGFGTGGWEYFVLCFNATQTQLVGGTSIPPSGNFGAVVNVNLTNLNPSAPVGGFGVSPYTEIRGMCLSPNGNFYGISIHNGGNFVGKVFGFTPTLTPLWSIYSGYTFANHGYITPNYQFSNPGPQNCIAASNCFVYTYNGDTLKKRSITNGALVAQIKITNATAGSCSGVLVDSCDNVYVGTTTGIRKYDSNLAFVTSAATSGAVYDMVFAPNQEIYAVGNTFVASVSGLVVNCVQSTLTLTTSTSAASCGQSNGTATVTTVGGTAPFVYVWSVSSNSSNVATGLTAGVYTVTVTDASCNPLIKTATITIGGAASFTANIASFTNATCNGSATGGAVSSVTGGLGPFNYLWSNGHTNSQLTNVAAGTYTITVSDGFCSSSASIVLTEPPPFSITITPIDLLCNANNSGNVSVLGGSTYAWSNGATTSSIANLSAGNYSVTVYDSNNCSITNSVLITEPPLLNLLFASSSDNCLQSIGSISVTPSGGTGAYTYAWNTGASSNIISALSAGTYSVSVTDANGCSITGVDTVLSIAPLSINLLATNPLCNGQTTGIIVANAQGTSPYIYNWSNAGTGAIISAIGAGTYSVEVTDSSGCKATASVQIIDPPLLSVTLASLSDSICEGEKLLFQALPTGGTPNYTYSWNTGSILDTLLISPTNTTLFWVQLTDANGCTATSSKNIVIKQSPQASFSVDTTFGCTSLCVNFTNTSSSTIQYWDFGDGTYSTHNTPLHCYTQDGTFSVELVVTNTLGCSDTVLATNHITIYPGPKADFIINPEPAEINTIVNFTNQSTSASNWFWSFGDATNSLSTEENPFFIYSDTGYFQVQQIVQNSFGCKDTISKQLYVDTEFMFFTPNTFTPNGDGINDVFVPMGLIDVDKYTLLIFDRWGDEIFKSNDVNYGWEGRANDGKELAQQDTYVWLIKLFDKKGGRHSFVGHVNVVK